jgi:hypothetical protein
LQDILVLSDLEIGVRRESKGHVKYQQTRVPVGINPWRLAHISTEDAARAAVNARQNSHIIWPAGPQPSLNTDTEGSSQSTSGEIKVIGSKRRNHYHLPPEKNWELNSTKLLLLESMVQWQCPHFQRTLHWKQAILIALALRAGGLGFPIQEVHIVGVPQYLQF